MTWFVRTRRELVNGISYDTDYAFRVAVKLSASNPSYGRPPCRPPA